MFKLLFSQSQPVPQRERSITKTSNISLSKSSRKVLSLYPILNKLDIFKHLSKIHQHKIAPKSVPCRQIDGKIHMAKLGPVVAIILRLRLI
jgi:hypothetical protein